MKLIRPMLATLSPTIVEGPEWVFEEKYDGIRAVVGRERGRVKIWSRTLQDLTSGFPHIVDAVSALPDGDLMLDGELVALDPKGVSRFQLFQRRGMGGPATRYAVFDLLQHDGRTLMPRALKERRAALERAIGSRSDPIFISRRMVRDGKAAYGEAKRLGWEGVIAKDEGSHYEPEVRSRYWRKVKVRKESEFVLGGYTAPKGGRQHLGALLWACTRARSCDMWARSAPLPRSTGLLSESSNADHNYVPVRSVAPMRDRRGVRPKLVAQIVYAEWTADGKLRQPSFLGLRTDKSPSECTWSDRER